MGCFGKKKDDNVQNTLDEGAKKAEREIKVLLLGTLKKIFC
jgi:hypothetical protein